MFYVCFRANPGKWISAGQMNIVAAGKRLCLHHFQGIYERFFYRRSVCVVKADEPEVYVIQIQQL